jgi:hypothetical protein
MQFPNAYTSAAQPSARGHFFACQGFLECPQDFSKSDLDRKCPLNVLKKAILPYIFIFKSKICPPRLFVSKICPIDKKVGHRWHTP